MAINLTDFDKIWASTSPLTPYAFSDANYQEGWNFVGATPPARQMWDSYMKFSDEKQQYIVNNFLPLSGGTLTGNVGVNLNSFRLYSAYENNSGNIVIYGGANSGSCGASLQVHGKSSSGGAGFFNLTADNGTDSKLLQGRPNGTLTWDGQAIQTSSDKRLKTDFADVPADVLEAWENVEWKQFKYIADKEKKGDSCRFHTGLVAQDVLDACGEEILRYGILCKNEETEMWTVRYTEALCMEVAFLRKKLKAIEEKLAKLEK